MKNTNKKLKIVTVANNLEVFDKVIKNNGNVKDFEVFLYDNSKENIGIAERYNSFINENVKQDSNFWIIFCHQDFGFNENPYNKISKLNKKHIYGPIGLWDRFVLSGFIKSLIFKSFGFYPSIKLDFCGINPLNKKKFINIEKFPMNEILLHKRRCLGRIKQGQNDDNFDVNGRKLLFPKDVDCLDCCCMIVHSSLINKYNLLFDENLDWHMYVEDFCYNAQKNYKIKTKAVQFNCYHLGAGTLN